MPWLLGYLKTVGSKMAEKDAHQELNEKRAIRTEDHKAETLSEIQIGPILSELVAFADELNTRNISETTAKQRNRQSQLRWQKGYVVLTATLAALTLGILYLFYRTSAKLATTEEDQAKIIATQAAMLDKQRTMAESTVTAMKAQLDEQVAADRPAIIANGAIPAKLGKMPQSWIQIETKGIPPKNVAVSWHNFGNSIATDFVQKGRLMLAKSGDPAPIDPECNEFRRPEKQNNRTSLAPDNTMFVVWSGSQGTDLTDATNSQTVYAVGCAYYNGLAKGRFFSDVCLLWLPNQQPEFQLCQDANRNYIH
jgi:hypothetical protein